MGVDAAAAEGERQGEEGEEDQDEEGDEHGGEFKKMTGVGKSVGGYSRRNRITPRSSAPSRTSASAEARGTFGPGCELLVVGRTFTGPAEQ